jgi:hypothetical protein
MRYKGLPMLSTRIYLTLVCAVACPCSPQTAAVPAGADDSIMGRQADQVCLSEILVPTLPPHGRAQVAAAKRRANDARNAIRLGIAFADVAQAISSGPSASPGGAIGCFGRGVLAHTIEEQVFGMKAGEMSEVIATTQGFVIRQVTERDPDSTAEVRSAQSAGERPSGLRGTVVVKFGHVPISSAYILVHPDRGGDADVHARTAANGKYVVQLPLGIYDVLISAIGFSPMSRKIQVTPDGMMTFDAALELNELGLERQSAAR